MTRKWAVIAAGVAILLAAIWGGSYFFHISDGQWWSFPALATAVGAAISGYAIAAYGFICAEE